MCAAFDRQQNSGKISGFNKSMTIAYVE